MNVVILSLVFVFIGMFAAAPQPYSGWDSTEKPRFTNWTTEADKKGNPRLVLFAIQGAIKEYQRQVAAGNQYPDTLQIEILLPRSKRTIGQVDEKVDPTLKQKFRSAIEEAENILKNSKTPRRLQ